MTPSLMSRGYRLGTTGVASLRGPTSRHCARRQQSSFERHVAAVASRWQHRV